MLPASAWSGSRERKTMSVVKKFPKYLNSQIQLAWWEIDVVAVTVFSVYIGVFLRGPFYITIFLFPYYYNKFKKNYPRGFLKHLTYFIGLKEFKGYPSFFEKRFLE
jgi:type IV conjugative transfer system protein TraL